MGFHLKRRYGDMVVGADRYIQMDEPLLVQLLQQLLVQLRHFATSWLAPVLACL